MGHLGSPFVIQVGVAYDTLHCQDVQFEHRENMLLLTCGVRYHTVQYCEVLPCFPQVYTKQRCDSSFISAVHCYLDWSPFAVYTLHTLEIARLDDTATTS